MDFLKVGKK